MNKKDARFYHELRQEQNRLRKKQLIKRFELVDRSTQLDSSTYLSDKICKIKEFPIDAPAFGSRLNRALIGVLDREFTRIGHHARLVYL